MTSVMWLHISHLIHGLMLVLFFPSVLLSNYLFQIFYQRYIYNIWPCIQVLIELLCFFWHVKLWRFKKQHVYQNLETYDFKPMFVYLCHFFSVELFGKSLFFLLHMIVYFFIKDSFKWTLIGFCRIITNLSRGTMSF